jgi:hypothetical protein
MTTDSPPQDMGRARRRRAAERMVAERQEALTAFVARRKAEGGAPTDF